ncbi:hypothetical protein F6Y02_41510 (plasmid) [Bacillus megaterium]|nr:hypothetical protein [Priestia megaterium]
MTLLKQHFTFENAVMFFKTGLFSSFFAICLTLCGPLNLGNPITIALVLGIAKFQIIGFLICLTGYLLLHLTKWAIPLIRSQWEKYFTKKKSIKNNNNCV